MWYSSRSAVGGLGTRNYGGIWGSRSVGWPKRRRDGSRKGICCPIRQPTDAQADRDPAQVRGVAGDRVHQGQERDPSGAGVRGAKAESGLNPAISGVLPNAGFIFSKPLMMVPDIISQP